MTDDGAPVRPAPLRTFDNEQFWDAATQGRLVAQRCGDCGELRHPPRPMCPVCRSTAIDEVELSGLGEVYTYAILHHPQNPRFSYPVLAVVVELDEGLRMVSSLTGVDAGEVHIGMPVEVVFEPTEGDAAVPLFRPRVAGVVS